MGGYMDYARFRRRSAIAERFVGSFYPPNGPDGYPLPKPGFRYPERDMCWVCEQPVPEERRERGTCSEYHQGAWDADCGTVSDRVNHPALKVSRHLLIGDLNRMEACYLEPESDLVQSLSDNMLLSDSPLHRTSRATGVGVEIVRRVLTFVFRDDPYGTRRR